MKPFNLIWVLGMACVVGACAEWIDQPVVEGCEVETDDSKPSYGDCVGSVPEPGPGPGGAGGTGGTGGTAGAGGTPTTFEFTNADSCCDGEAEGDPTCTDDASLVDCDYGCNALLNDFGFAFILGANPGAEDGGSFDVTFGGEAVISEAFIEGAEGVVGDITTAEIVAGGSLPLVALSGATGADIVLTLEEVELDLDADNGGTPLPGPFSVPIVPGSGTYSGTMGDTACFNFAKLMEFGMNVTDPIFVPATFKCEPVNQVDINADPVVVTPEAESGQLCFPIP